SFGWRQPVAALIAFAAAAGPLLVAAGWMIGGADGPLERRDPVQVPAFVAEESGTEDQARTLVLGSESAAQVSYSLVRGSGARLGDAELAAAAADDERLDKIVARLVAGSGADQADQLGGYAVRYVLVRDGAPRQMSRTLDATPGLTRLSQEDGSALWRVDRQVARAAVVPRTGDPEPVAAGPVELHTKIESGDEGRVLRLADSADPGWTATLDGRPLPRTTVDGWAQGFELPTAGGHLDVTYDTPMTRTAWLWAQGALAVVLVVMALPGRRRDVDDDLPDEPVVPAQAVEGEGRRARRLRAQNEQAAQEAGQDVPPPPSEEAFAAVPHQQTQSYDAWEAPAPAGADQGAYDTGHPYQGGQYQGGQYPSGTYGQEAYRQGAYQDGAQYDPYASYGGAGGGYGGEQQYGQSFDASYDAAYDRHQQHQDPPHGTDSERPDGSQQ
ncbi:family 2 glycosyl transferase, partial [Streptomyces sp. SID335]|nr:family 2 glycosyl transferase [Streptomyces sp. SID335]